MKTNPIRIAYQELMKTVSDINSELDELEKKNDTLESLPPEIAVKLSDAVEFFKTKFSSPAQLKEIMETDILTLDEMSSMLQATNTLNHRIGDILKNKILKELPCISELSS